MRTEAVLLILFSLSQASNVYWYDAPNTLPDRQLMVHLFEWKWTDVAKECENFLQHYGYGAVQVSPPMEHISIVQNSNMPWWIRYQPVSYKLSSRSGSESEFKDMVNRCNQVGVRVIVDVVMNHMVGVGQKKGVDGTQSSGSSDFDGTDGVETFSGVPYNSNNFNDFRCHGNIQNSDFQNSAEHVRNCRLVGLLDLNQGDSVVRNKLIEFLDSLIDIGVAGFRCDASKHMWPGDLEAILNGTKNLRSDIFGGGVRPFVVHEVIDRGGEAVKCTDYITIGRYTNFNFGTAVSSAARGQSDWRNVVNLGPGTAYGNGEDHDVLNFIDNHDNQRDSNPYVVTYKEKERYKLAVAFMLAWPYGYPRVMSSFYFSFSDQSPPNSGSQTNYATSSPTFNDDLTCQSDSGWVCEHRWPSIRQMAQFRSAVTGSAASDIFTDYNRIAFARTGKGFFALNGLSNSWTKNFQTTLPPGDYCDQYSGSLRDGKCYGAKITVRNEGQAGVTIPGLGVIAISLSSRIGPVPPPTPTSPNMQKTVVFLQAYTDLGENMFIRGGKSEVNHDNCLKGPYQQQSDPCAIPIVHNTTVPFVYGEYLSWKELDQFLDFEGDEQNQGTHDGQKAFGTPLAYSTNDKSAVEYQPLNTYGPNYWMVQFLMDCSKTESGWFELKGYLTPSTGWESNISQTGCKGSVGGTAPFKSINHIALCGKVNVFRWNSPDCQINNF